MEETKTQNNELVGFDDIMINHLVYSISESNILLNFLDRYEKQLYLNRELTKEQKYILRRDYGWTSEAIKYMGEAAKAYKKLSFCLDHVADIMDVKVKNADYDSMQKDTNDIIALSLIYAAQIWTNPKAKQSIHDFILNYAPLSEGVQSVYKYFKGKSVSL